MSVDIDKIDPYGYGCGGGDCRMIPCGCTAESRAETERELEEWHRARGDKPLTDAEYQALSETHDPGGDTDR